MSAKEARGRLITGSRYILLLLIFLLPVFVLPWTGFAFDEMKIVLASGLTLLAVALWIVHSLRAGGITIRWSMPLLLWLSFALWVVVSGIVNQVGYRGWAAVDGVFSFSVLHVGLLSVLGWLWVQIMDERWLQKALRALTVAMAIGVGISALVMLQQWFSWVWLSELVNPIASEQLQLGLGMVLGFFLLMFRWKEVSSPSRWWAFTFSLLSFAILIVLDLSVAWIAMSAGVVAALSAGWKRWSVTERVGLSVVGLLALGGLGLPLQSWIFHQSYDPLPYLRVGAIVVLDQPGQKLIVGEGPQQGGAAFSRTRATAEGEAAEILNVFPREQRVVSFASQLVDTLLSVGVVGLLLFLLVVGFAMMERSRETQHAFLFELRRWVVLVILTVGWIASSFSFLWMTLFVLLLLSHPVMPSRSLQWKSSSIGRALAMVGAVLLFSLVVVAGAVGFRMAQAAILVGKVHVSIANGIEPLPSIEQKITRARRLNPWDSRIALDLAENRVVQGQFALRQGQTESAQGQFASAIIIVDQLMRGPKDLMTLDRAFKIHVAIAEHSASFANEFRGFLVAASGWEPESALWRERLAQFDQLLETLQTQGSDQ